MKKIISFCLFKGIPKNDLNGVINCFLAPKIYPGWTCRFYVDDSLPMEIRQALETFEHVEIVDMPIRHIGNSGMLWRFLPASDESVDVMISRDADSWLNSREKVSVEKWVESDKGSHIIRDHCYHSWQMMAGMWGTKKGVVPHMEELIKKQYEKIEATGSAMYECQPFLRDNVYPLIIDDCMIHLGDQYDNKGVKTNGHHNDGGVPFEEYTEDDEPVEGFSFGEISNLNANFCSHCKKTHAKFIGGIMEKIPTRALAKLKEYFIQHGITTTMIDSYK